MRHGSFLSRRTFIGAALGMAAIPAVERFIARESVGHISGSIRGAAALHGHLLREDREWIASSSREVPILIIGGGVAGLSAAWALHKHGFTDFELLELESRTGGNAQSGANEVSEYPWGAHYIPVPGKDAVLVRRLFEELGVITGYHDDKPLYREEYLCAAPHERLHQYGVWEEGLYPQIGVSGEDRAQYRRWHHLMDSFAKSKGSDGKPAFTIPVDLSSSDPRFRALDEISMDTFLDQHGFDSDPLRWYVNYCCLDDYGAPLPMVSAWAGVHYFASRTPWSANVEGEELLTWPAGNGWVVQQLTAQLSSFIKTKRLVVSIDDGRIPARVLVLDLETNVVEAIDARAVIFCAPRFTAPRLIQSMRSARPAYLDAFRYHPWMVANVTLSRCPADSPKGLAWDNVLYHSSSLGYVNATHQELGRRAASTVITYYLPLVKQDGGDRRREALERPWQYWRDTVVADLKAAHPDIVPLIQSIDVWLWGHGMICPSPGFLWGAERTAALARQQPIYFAHSDMSGISIFEEAQYRGVIAAEQCLLDLGKNFQSLQV